MFLNKWQNILLRNLKNSPVQILNPSRDISLNAQPLFAITHYEALGITRLATHTDIKAAYYKLSLIYHPDKNKGSEVAAEKFRDITAAYEILGNFRLRRLYDKGIIHTAGAQYAEYDIPNIVEDDPQTKFYKARMTRSEVPHSSGRTPIYDFDEWSRQHYGASFERRRAAKERHERQEAAKLNRSLGIQNEFLLFGIIVVIIIFLLIFLQEKAYDTNNIKTKKKV